MYTLQRLLSNVFLILRHYIISISFPFYHSCTAVALHLIILSFSMLGCEERGNTFNLDHLRETDKRPFSKLREG
jgi:hypothetical protein